jgi:hypothetical protein
MGKGREKGEATGRGRLQMVLSDIVDMIEGHHQKK